MFDDGEEQRVRLAVGLFADFLHRGSGQQLLQSCVLPSLTLQRACSSGRFIARTSANVGMLFERRKKSEQSVVRCTEVLGDVLESIGAPGEVSK